MPTDSLVDVVTLVKLVNVRKSKAEEAGKHAGDLLDDNQGLWDVVELGPLQLIGDDHVSRVDNKMGQVPVPSPSGTYIIGKDGIAKPVARGVPVPVPAKQKYQRLPADFDEKALKYISDHPGCNLGEVSRLFDANVKTVHPHLESLINQGKLIKSKTGNSRMAPVKYYLTDKKIAEKPQEKVEKEAEVEKPVKAPAKDEELVPDKKIVSHVWGMPAGPEKDARIKELIIEVLSHDPGSSTSNISDRIRQPTTTIRKFLVELEEEKKIERRMVPGNQCAKTGYYLKDIPMEVVS